jgi:hypothetical protein
MRLPYEPPEIALLGSVKDLTQANIVGPTPDNLTVVTVHGISIPGDAFS